MTNKPEQYHCGQRALYIDYGKWRCDKCGKYINKSGKLKV